MNKKMAKIVSLKATKVTEPTDGGIPIRVNAAQMHRAGMGSSIPVAKAALCDCKYACPASPLWAKFPLSWGGLCPAVDFQWLIIAVFLIVLNFAYAEELPEALRFITNSVIVEYGQPDQSSASACQSSGKNGVCTSMIECSITFNGISNKRSSGQCEDAQVCCTDARNLPSSVIEDITQPCGWRRLTMSFADDQAQVGEFPWMATLFAVIQTNGGADERLVYIGGGSLIHPRVVLTAAHYVAPLSAEQLITVKVGLWNQQDEDSYPSQDSAVVSVNVHENYQPASNLNDIALLFLEQSIQSAPNVGVVCLPNSRQLAAAGEQCLVSGWGNTPVVKTFQRTLKKVELPVVPHAKCEQQLRQTNLSIYFILDDGFMCAGGQPQVDTCMGDGGSPLVCPIEENRYVQRGIVSWGIGCGQNGIPGVYVDVAVFREWIDDKVTEQGYATSAYTI